MRDEEPVGVGCGHVGGNRKKCFLSNIRYTVGVSIVVC